MKDLEYVYIVEAEGYKPNAYVTYANAKKRVAWLKKDMELSGVLIPRAYCTKTRIEY